jgi:hypothetical protein
MLGAYLVTLQNSSVSVCLPVSTFTSTSMGPVCFHMRLDFSLYRRPTLIVRMSAACRYSTAAVEI